MYSPTRQRGNISENIVAQYIENNAYKTLARNYLRKWGEIDIIAVKNNIVHFIEVKSIFSNSSQNIFKSNLVSRETKSDSVKTIKTREYIDGFSMIYVSRETDISKVSCETSNFAPFDPAWNMTIKKRKSMVKAIKSYLAENYKEEIPDFQIDLAAVSLDYFNKTAYITFIDNIILEEM